MEPFSASESSLQNPSPTAAIGRPIRRSAAEHLVQSSRADLAKVSDAQCWLKLSLIGAGLGASLLAARFALYGGGASMLWLPAILASVWTQHAIAEEIHDGVHLRLLTSARANDWLSSFYAGLIGVSFAGFRREHILHHKNFGTPRDPDYEKYATAPSGLRGWLRYFLYYFSGVAAVNRLLRPPPSSGGRSGESKVLAQHPAGTAAIHFVLVITGVAAGNPYWYFVCWALPLLTLTYGITQFRTLLEHWSPDGWVDPKTGEPRAGALYNLQGWGQRNLFGAQFGYNFHGMHHMLPAVPNLKLGQATDIAGHYAADADQPIVTMSYFARVRQVLTQ